MTEKNKVAGKKKKKTYAQIFREEWILDPEFTDWLQPDVNDKFSSYCTCCKMHLKRTNRSMLLAHKKTTKHKNFFAGLKRSELLKKRIILTEKEKVAKAELLLACYFTEHGWPYRYANHLMGVCKNAFHDCKIARKIILKKTKLSYLIQDGITYHEKEELAEICRNQKFSIMIDERLDMSISNRTAVVVRFFDTQKLDLVDVLFDTMSPETGTNEDIYNAVKMLFVNKNIPLDNIIGFGGDNCLNGVFTLLKAEVPTVFGIGCDCHSFSLCFNNAIKLLPSYLETFLHDLALCFVNKGKQLTDFGVNVDIVHSVQDKVQEMSSTSSWLSYENIINVVLDQWQILTQYFESKYDTVDTLRQIYTFMVARGTKHMLLFLQYILQKVNAFNTEFQAEEFRIHVLHSLISQSYREILSCFIEDDVILKYNLSDIDPRDSCIHRQHDDLFLGGKAMALLYQDPLEQYTEQFQISCLQFLVEFSYQIKQNFPIQEDGIVANLNILDPTVAQDPKRSPTSISKLAFHFSTLIPEDTLNELDEQWRLFRISKDFLSSATTIPQYWYLLRNIKDTAGKPKFDILSGFMTNLSVLPHSSTAVERIFSEVNLLKTKYPNPLNSEAAKDRMIAKQMLTRKSITCCMWEPSIDLIKDAVSGVCLTRYQTRMETNISISGDGNQADNKNNGSSESD